MAFNCPHCSKTIDNAISQDTHRERLASKEEENKQLRARVTELEPAGANLATVTKERDEALGKLRARDEADARRGVFDKAGIPGDASVREGFELIYRSHAAGFDEDKVPTFEDWLSSDAAKAHPLLAAHYGKGGSSTGGSSTGGSSTGGSSTGGVKPATGGLQTGGLPSGDKGAGDPPQGSTIKSADELRAYFASPAFRALPRADQKKKREELQSQLTPRN